MIYRPLSFLPFGPSILEPHLHRAEITRMQPLVVNLKWQLGSFVSSSVLRVVPKRPNDGQCVPDQWHARTLHLSAHFSRTICRKFVCFLITWEAKEEPKGFNHLIQPLSLQVDLMNGYVEIIRLLQRCTIQ